MCAGDLLWGGGRNYAGLLFDTSASQAEQDKDNDGAMRPLLPVMGDPLISGKRITSIASEKATSLPPLPLIIISAHVCVYVCVHVMLWVCAVLCVLR